MSIDKPPLHIGIDGGGTKCRAVVFDDEHNPLSSAIAGPANVAKYGTMAYESIVDAVEQALRAIKLDIVHDKQRLFVSAGLAGVNVTSAAQALANWQHPFARFDFITDIHAALLGAHGGSDGAVLIAGTGSCAASLRNNIVTQFGGHGFTLGDKGSGAWLGKTMLSRTLECLDGVTRPSDFSVDICKRLALANSSDIVERFNLSPPADFAALAPLIIDAAQQRDPLALDIVKEGAEYLSTIAKSALDISTRKLVLVGGLSEAIKPWLDAEVLSSLVQAKHGPELGAVIYQKMKLSALMTN